MSTKSKIIDAIELIKSCCKIIQECSDIGISERSRDMEQEKLDLWNLLDNEVTSLLCRCESYNGMISTDDKDYKTDKPSIDIEKIGDLTNLVDAANRYYFDSNIPIWLIWTPAIDYNSFRNIQYVCLWKSDHGTPGCEPPILKMLFKGPISMLKEKLGDHKYLNILAK